ncbi:MAG: S46 family peptidase [Ignavibacteriales bacterium]|nr:S46 family peptidase [Ignavibacteriales bacterium]
MTRAELKEIDKQLAAFTANNTYSARYWLIANELVRYAKQMQLPEDKRDTTLKSKRYLEMRNNLFPKNYDPVLEEAKLIINLDYLVLNLGSDHKLVSSFFNGLNSEVAAKKLIATTLFKDRETVLAMFEKSPERYSR